MQGEAPALVPHSELAAGGEEAEPGSDAMWSLARSKKSRTKKGMDREEEPKKGSEEEAKHYVGSAVRGQWGERKKEIGWKEKK